MLVLVLLLVLESSKSTSTSTNLRTHVLGSESPTPPTAVLAGVPAPAASPVLLGSARAELAPGRGIPTTGLLHPAAVPLTLPPARTAALAPAFAPGAGWPLRLGLNRAPAFLPVAPAPTALARLAVPCGQLALLRGLSSVLTSSPPAAPAARCALAFAAAVCLWLTPPSAALAPAFAPGWECRLGLGLNRTPAFLPPAPPAAALARIAAPVAGGSLAFAAAGSLPSAIRLRLPLAPEVEAPPGALARSLRCPLSRGPRATAPFRSGGPLGPRLLAAGPVTPAEAAPAAARLRCRRAGPDPLPALAGDASLA